MSSRIPSSRNLLLSIHTQVKARNFTIVLTHLWNSSLPSPCWKPKTCKLISMDITQKSLNFLLNLRPPLSSHLGLDTPLRVPKTSPTFNPNTPSSFFSDDGLGYVLRYFPQWIVCRGVMLSLVFSCANKVSDFFNVILFIQCWIIHNYFVDIVCQVSETIRLNGGCLFLCLKFRGFLYVDFLGVFVVLKESLSINLVKYSWNSFFFKLLLILDLWNFFKLSLASVVMLALVFSFLGTDFYLFMRFCDSLECVNVIFQVRELLL